MSDTDMDLPEKGPGLPGHEDPRPDIEQAVMARSDAVARGEGGHAVFDLLEKRPVLDQRDLDRLGDARAPFAVG